MSILTYVLKSQNSWEGNQFKKKKKDFTDFENFKICRKCDRLSGKRTLEAKYFTQNIGGVFKI